MKLTVYKNQYGFSTLAKNGEDKMYVSVQFRKGQEPTEEKTEIKVNDAFFSMYKDKNNLAKPKFVVLDYTVEGEQHGDAWEDPFATVIDDGTLPF